MINWKILQREKEENKIKLRKYAMSDAAQGIPKDSNMTDTENEISAKATSHFNEIRNIGINFFGKLEPEINKLQQTILNAEDTFSVIFKNVQNEIKQAHRLATQNIKNQRDNLIKLQKDLTQFKAQNHINRSGSPITPLKFIVSIGIILTLFWVEKEVNAEIAGAAFAGGKNEGRVVSTSVAGLNVFLSFVIGFFAVKQIFHSDKMNKIIGKIILLLYIPFVFYINFAFGALRAIAQEFANQGNDYEQSSISFIQHVNDKGIGSMDMFPKIPVETFDKMIQQALVPWSDKIPWDYQSFVLVSIGLAFGIFSILDGYLFDDRYPGYGSITRKRDIARNKLEATYLSLIKKTHGIANYGRKKLIKDNDHLKNTIDTWSKKTKEFQNEISGYKNSLSNAEDIFDHMWKEYIIQNMQYRDEEYKSDIPKRFKDAQKEGFKIFKYGDDKLPEVVFSSHFNVFKNDNERNNNMNEYHKTVQNHFTHTREEIDKFEEDTTQKIKEEFSNASKV